MATLTSQIQALITYANEVTGKNSASLGDAVKALADGYNGGGTDYTLPYITDAGSLGSQLTALIAYANGITGENDTTIGDAVRNLAEWYGSKLPKGYTECEYLESTGTQYILTDIIPTAKDVVKLDFVLYVENVELISSNLKWDEPNPNNKCVIIKYTTGRMWNIWSLSVLQAIAPKYDIIGQKAQVSVDFNNKTFVDSTGVFSRINFVGTESSSQPPLRIFQNGKRIRFYEISISNGNDVDFIPALDPSGRPCMYDTVSKRAFYNSGTGEFLYKVLEK